jgi:hypothetical protein
VLTLMLLWRKGVIQLHDSSPKARPAVEWLLRNTAQSGIGWADCREYAYREEGGITLSVVPWLRCQGFFINQKNKLQNT